MKLMHRLSAFFTAAAMTLTLLPGVPAAAADTALFCETYQGSNIGKHDYSRWAAPVTSNLVATDSGWMRVQGGAIPKTETENAKALIEYYSADFELTGRKLVDLQLPIWGGFHEGSDGNYYLITGQNNADNDNTIPVVDIAKYSSDWKLVKHTSLKNSSLNTAANDGIAEPFRSGSVLTSLLLLEDALSVLADGYGAHVRTRLNM